MNYEQKYKEALERAKYALTTDMDNSGHWAVNYIFPELKESESERMKKAIMHILYENYTDAAVIEGVEIAEIAAWLEKQVEKDPCTNCISDKGCVTCENGDLKEIKVEPKFNVGDWITTTDEEGNVTTEKIIEFWGDKVRLIDIDGFYALWPKHELNYYHLWTNNDAKDGDILVMAKDCSPFIFRGFTDPLHRGDPVAYGGIDGQDNMFIPGSENRWWDDGKIQPATKEQRDLLFAEMKEAGYEWDAEKKELKKIEDKMLAADEVIEWIHKYWPYSWGNFTLQVDGAIEKFKKDFGL